MKKSLVAVMLGLMMTIAMTGCGGCGAEEVVIETEVVEEETEVVEETEVETEVVEEKAETEVETETTEEPATEAVEEVSPYTYTELNQVMYAQSTVNVRDLPEQTGGKVGSLTTNQEVTVTGQCNETGWYRISYNGSEGFVSNSYLGTEKVAVSSGGSSSGTSSGSSGGSTSTPAETSSPASEPAEEIDPYAGMTVEEAMDSITIYPDSYYCGFCDIEIADHDEYISHLREVHNMQ